ncbi:DUF1697 domain-containing protein [Nocardia cyriacigeorgica]|uniref:DUF1697 domain-containing protein n=1 Tax=Nocardia cyriacigeorgica TaxID=135487 RepID=UPI0013D39D11|nr:DUF1697 domain-containing protein [Nocardia cyriacigeorgica]MBF6456710.1 DUF1697 domain-containing protein [Nocardia cyriacigeorgica]MBF6476653.1 DUF1697 domain-containing protein [Nocardia cyriacigeorgica]MBF6551515.1 DUF1697 domain-containing protein [Nocardia cyriacigeorgica]NEW29636.1 DUF1697 domain-containing protein [Nocardia cyriacigeorgica]
MTRYAALLRGIAPMNPNMTNDKLRGVFTGLGFEAVASVLSSGNIVFRTGEADPAELEDRIQRALNRELGIPGGTIIRDYDELRTLLDSDPFEGLTHGRGTYLTATFLKSTSNEPIELPDDPDPLTRVVGYDPAARVFLFVVDNSTPRTPDFMAWLERTYGKDITTRTWLTVQRVVKKMEAIT